MLGYLADLYTSRFHLLSQRQQMVSGLLSKQVMFYQERIRQPNQELNLRSPKQSTPSASLASLSITVRTKKMLIFIDLPL